VLYLRFLRRSPSTPRRFVETFLGFLPVACDPEELSQQFQGNWIARFGIRRSPKILNRPNLVSFIPGTTDRREIKSRLGVMRVQRDGLAEETLRACSPANVEQGNCTIV
jgi:hypothetical protein